MRTQKKQRKYANTVLVRAVDKLTGSTSRERVESFAVRYNASANTTYMHYIGAIPFPKDKAAMLDRIEQLENEIEGLKELIN